MSTQPAFIVNKRGGFLTALVQGFFGFLIVSVICATAIGIYGFWIVDRNASQLMGALGNLSTNLQNWRQLAPPVLADAFSDTRDLEYLKQLEIKVQLVAGRRDRNKTTVFVKVTNRGDRTVTWLTGRIVVSDHDGVPLREFVTKVATPLPWRTEHDEVWRGQLLPQGVREFTVEDFDAPRDAQVSCELTDIRVWVRPGAAPTTPGGATIGSGGAPAESTVAPSSPAPALTTPTPAPTTPPPAPTTPVPAPTPTAAPTTPAPTPATPTTPPSGTPGLRRPSGT